MEEKETNELKVNMEMNGLTLLFTASQELLIEGYLENDKSKIQLGVCIGNLTDKLISGIDEMMTAMMSTLLTVHELNNDQIAELDEVMKDEIKRQGNLLSEAFNRTKKLISEKREKETEDNGNDAEQDTGITREPKEPEEGSK